MKQTPQLQLACASADTSEEASPSASSVLETNAQLFTRYGRYVAFIGLRLLGSESDADDLVQRVFLDAFERRDQLRDPRAVRGWLATIAVRTARRQLRRRRLRQFVGLEDRAALDLRDRGLSPEKHAVLARVYEVLDSMPVDQRVAWTLRHVEGEKLVQVAERCGCSLATAKRRITAAHAHLQAEMLHDE